MSYFIRMIIFSIFIKSHFYNMHFNYLYFINRNTLLMIDPELYRIWKCMKNLNNYLNIKIKRTRREKKTATLSIVLNITKSCRLRLGIKRTSFKMRNSRKVRRTDRPELPAKSCSLPILCVSSNALFKKI